MTPAPLLEPDADGLATAARLLREGGLVAFPTETVYGLGANALDPIAVQGIFDAKGRPGDNPLIVHLADADGLGELVVEVTPLARKLAEAFWPGPLTLVLDARSEVPRITTGGLGTVAVRVPDHPVATALLAEAGVPVAAPSANRSGRPSPTTAAHVLRDLGDAADAVVDGGPCPVGVESTVVDARGDLPLVLREGSITREDLGLGAHAEQPSTAALTASPGTRYRHYAPSCEVLVAPACEARESAARAAAAGRSVGIVSTAPAPSGVVEVLRFRDAAHLAQQLYAALRAAEDAHLDLLVVEAVAEEAVGRAVMDRLRRAAAG